MAEHLLLRVEEVHVAGGDDGLAHLLAKPHDAAVEVPQRLLAADRAVVEQEAVVAQRHDLQVVIERRDAPQLAVALAAQHGVEHLARLAGRADQQPLAVFCEHALGDGRVSLKVFQIGLRNDLVEIFQSRFVLYENGHMARVPLFLQPAAHEVVEIADRLCAALGEHGQELAHDARNDHRVVRGAVVVEVRQTQAVGHHVQLVALEVGQQILREHERVQVHRLERDAAARARGGHKAGVEIGVVRDDRPVARKVEEHAHGRALVRRAGNVRIRDAGQACDLRRDGHVRIDERVEHGFDLPAGEDDGADFRHAVRVQMQAGRLNIERNELRVERQLALPVDGQMPVHVVDEVALLTVDDLHAVFLCGLPHVREGLRDAMVRDRDGRVPPVGGTLHECGGVGQRIERRVARM